jgi:hypothetical protein
VDFREGIGGRVSCQVAGASLLAPASYQMKRSDCLSQPD